MVDGGSPLVAARILSFGDSITLGVVLWRGVCRALLLKRGSSFPRRTRSLGGKNRPRASGEMAAALVLRTSVFGREGSTPSLPTSRSSGW